MQKFSYLVKKGIQKPHRILPHVYTYGKKKLNAVKYRSYPEKKNIPRQKEYVEHLLEDNDEFVLVILDSCRFDYFEQEIDSYLDGSLECVWSAGSRTPKWTPNMWDSEYNLDYISMNGWPVSEDNWKERRTDFNPNNTFRETVQIKNTEKLLSATPPEYFTDAVLQYLRTREKVRCVVHYSRPHRPYIGETKILPWRIEKNTLISDLNKTNINLDINKSDLPDRDYLFGEELYTLDLPAQFVEELDLERYEVRERIADGFLSDTKLQTAYRDNLRKVLPQVQRLVSYFDCEIVISADHGEHLGEYNELVRYNHPAQPHPVLREVPWFEVSNCSKGKNRLDEIEENHEILKETTRELTAEEVKENLADLGYI